MKDWLIDHILVHRVTQRVLALCLFMVIGAVMLVLLLLSAVVVGATALFLEEN